MYQNRSRVTILVSEPVEGEGTLVFEGHESRDGVSRNLGISGRLKDRVTSTRSFQTPHSFT